MELGRKPDNQEIARVFRWLAAAFEVKGDDFFRARAYQNAAESVDHTSASLRDLWQEEKLDTVAGLGPNLIEHLNEWFKTGKVKHFDSVMKKLPAGMFPLLNLPDVGPKTAYRLAKELRLDSEKTAVKELAEAIDAGKLDDLEGIGKKTIAQLRAAAGAARRPREQKHRLLLPQAESIAEEVITYLRDCPEVVTAEALGSLRRRSATVGDVDIAVQTEKPETVFVFLKKFPKLKKLAASGENTGVLIHESGYQIDVKTHSKAGWANLLQHYTGSKNHNIHLRTLAKEKGQSISEYRVKTKSGDKRFATEQELYHFLGMEYIPPELREDAGEIEAAMKKQLPHLVEPSDIQGDFHVHTNLDWWPTSHDMSVSSFDEIFAVASELGYSTLGFSDHQPKSSDLSARDRLSAVKRRNEEIEKAAKKWNDHHSPKLHVLKGMEVDIRPDGTSALEDESLQQLDYVIASVHSQFTQSVDEATKRVLKALSNPKVKIWGHPTGRMINKRQGLEFDWPQIFAFCAKEKKLIEINAYPERLDLPDALVRSAIAAGCRLIINTDAHAAEHLKLMKYGVWTARRGWAERKDIANAKTGVELEKFLLHS